MNVLESDIWAPGAVCENDRGCFKKWRLLIMNLMPFLFLALSIGFVHTLLGPDHYLPFIALSKARRWSLQKTILITLGCGLGHVLSSVILGFLGLGFGWAVGELVSIEDQRGTMAGWLLLSFGLLYMLWGVRKGILGQTHTHVIDGKIVSHSHDEGPHESNESEHVDKHRVTPWMLFLIFVFGPCEPLIPILMYPAVQKDVWTLLGVVIAFAVSTLLTMVGVVWLAYRGLNFVKLGWLERWTHAFAGGAISMVAAGMVFLGW